MRFLLWFTLESEADLSMLGVKTSQWTNTLSNKSKTAVIQIAALKLALFTCSNSQLHLTRKTSLDCCHCHCLDCSMYLPDFQELSLPPPPTIPGIFYEFLLLKVEGHSFFFFTPDISEDLTSVCPTYAHSLSVDPIQDEAWSKGIKLRGITCIDIGSPSAGFAS